MRHLALIISHDLGRLEIMRVAAQKAGFSINCCNDLKIAGSLIVRYSDDYHIVIVDEATAAGSAATFIKGTRGNAPKSRVVIALAEGSSFTYADPLVTVVPFEKAMVLLPRLKREVTRYRSSPITNVTAS